MPAMPETAVAPTRLRAVLLAGALFTFFFAAYAFTMSADLNNNGDTNIRIAIAENLLQGHVDLKGWTMQFPLHIKKEFYDSRLWWCTNGVDVCSTYLLGQPLAIIPIDLAGSAITRHERWPLGPGVTTFDHLVGPLFGSLEAVVFFLFAVALGYGRRRSLVLTLIFAFATSVWPDEQSVLEHTEVAFFVLLGVYLAYQARHGGRGRLMAILAGAALGGAAMTRYQDAAVGVLGVAIYLLWPGMGWRRLGYLSLVGIGLLPFIGLDLWWDWVRFGSPLATGHHETLLGYAAWLGAPGLWVSPGKGLLWYSPTIFLMAPAAVPFARRFPSLAASFVAMVLAFTAFYSIITFWHGDPAWGPRYMYPVLPYVTLPLGVLFTRRWRFPAMVWLLTAIFVLAGLTVQLAAVTVSEWRGWYRVIQYEQNQGHPWLWIASRYRYFWNVHESPLNFQLRSLYQLTYDSVFHSSRYVIAPPAEEKVLDDLANNYAINQWNIWWASNEYNWWMGEQKVILGVILLLSLMLAGGTYIGAELGGLFEQPAIQVGAEPLPEAA